MAGKRAGRRSGVVGFLRESAIIVIGALIASTLLRTFLIQVFVIPSESMESTLLRGDRIAVQKVTPYQRGDVVVFRDDLGWMSTETRVTPWQSALMFVGVLPDESQNYLVKRVIGVPGDHVTCCDSQGRVLVNGVPLDETAYLYIDPAGEQVKPSEKVFDIVVPQGRIFVMGDHRNDSADSRCHLGVSNNGVMGGAAFISEKSIVGVGLATVFPFDRLRGHPRPGTFAGVPAPSGTPPASPIINGEPPRPC